MKGDDLFKGLGGYNSELKESLVFYHKVNFITHKKWGSTTVESGPQYIYISQSFVFSRENNIISPVLSVFSCYITCIAHTFHINVYKTKLMVGVTSLTHISIDT